MKPNVGNWRKYYLYKDNNNKLLELSKKSKVPINMMANYCISQYFPELVEKLTNKHNDLYRIALLDKRLADRNMIIEFKKEQKRRIYFFNNFIKDWRKLLNKTFETEFLKKKELSKLIHLYIKESDTYLDNKEMSLSLRKYAESLKNPHLTTEDLKNLFEITLVRIEDKKTIDSIK